MQRHCHSSRAAARPLGRSSVSTKELVQRTTADQTSPDLTRPHQTSPDLTGPHHRLESAFRAYFFLMWSDLVKVALYVLLSAVISINAIYFLTGPHSGQQYPGFVGDDSALGNGAPIRTRVPLLCGVAAAAVLLRPLRCC